ncbi:MAG: hypothetical protein ACI4VL_06500 [Bacilli bacterium]
MKEKIKNNKKKIVFDEKIDSSINGFALVFAFIIIGIILQFDNSFFGNATTIIKVVFVVVGILGLFTEISNLNISYNIKGLDNIGLGIFLLIISYILKVYITTNNWFNILSILYEMILFFVILLSIYGFCRGLIEMIYSLYKNYKEKNKKGKLFSSTMVILTQLFGLILILAQIYDIFK